MMCSRSWWAGGGAASSRASRPLLEKGASAPLTEEASLAPCARLLASRLVRARSRARARARARVRVWVRVRVRVRVQAVGELPALQPSPRSVVRVSDEQVDLGSSGAHLRLVAQEHDEALALVHAGRRSLLVQHEDLALRALQRRQERGLAWE